MEGEEERKQLRGRDGYERMKREYKLDNDPKSKALIIYIYIFFTFVMAGRRASRVCAGLLMHCSQQGESKSF